MLLNTNMTVALGHQASTNTLVAENLGTQSNPITTAYITNIVPPPGSGGANLQTVCGLGNSTNTGIDVTAGDLNVTADITAARVTTTGEIKAGTALEVLNGNLLVNTGHIRALDGTNGNLQTGTYIRAGTNINSTSGNITADNGNIVAQVGDIQTNAGDISSAGTITATGQINANNRLVVLGRTTLNDFARTTTIGGSASIPVTLSQSPLASRSTFTLGANHSLTVYCQPVATSNQAFIFEIQTTMSNVLKNFDIRVSFQTCDNGGGPSLGYDTIVIGNSELDASDNTRFTVLVNSYLPWTVQTAKINVLLDYDPTP